MPWRTIEGETLAPVSMPQLEVLLRGVFDKRRFLDLIRHFIVFEDDGGTSVIKKMAGYHQFHAVKTAVAETVRASGAGEMVLRRPLVISRNHSREVPRATGAGGGLAHTGFRQITHHGVLRRTAGSETGHGKSHAGRADGPQRSGRPAFARFPAVMNCCGKSRSKRGAVSI